MVRYQLLTVLGLGSNRTNPGPTLTSSPERKNKWVPAMRMGVKRMLKGQEGREWEGSKMAKGGGEEAAGTGARSGRGT